MERDADGVRMTKSPSPDDAATLASFRAASSPRERAALLLEDARGIPLVRRVPVAEVYATILEVGLSDAVDIVAAASPKQFQGFIDLAAWQRDRIDPLEVLRWLGAASEEALLPKVEALDLEILELIFTRLTRIYEATEDGFPDTTNPAIETPDRAYLLELLAPEPELSSLRQLIATLIERDALGFSRFVEAVRYETPMELEEVAFQYRQSRMADLGFPLLEEAVRVVSRVRLPPSSAVPGLVRTAPTSFVRAAFGGLDADERGTLDAEVRWVVNCVLVAEGAEPGDLFAIRANSELARGYLEVGLEMLTHGDPKRAVAVVREHRLDEILRIGLSRTLVVSDEARKLAKTAGMKHDGVWLLLDEETSMLEGLLRRRPVAVGQKPFTSLASLAEVQASLAGLPRQAEFIRKLLGPSPQATLDDFGLTLALATPQRILACAAANAEVEGAMRVAPVPMASLPALARGDGREKAGEVIAAALGLPSSEVEPLVRRVQGEVERELTESLSQDGKIAVSRVPSLIFAEA